MTAEEALRIIEAIAYQASSHNEPLTSLQLNQVYGLIEQQQQEIERLEKWRARADQQYSAQFVKTCRAEQRAEQSESQYAKADKRNEQLWAEKQEVSNNYVMQKDRADNLCVENSRMREALTWYADQRNEEAGEVARQALKGGAE